ncbi:MAG: 50S ribosomal protein L6 [Bacteroidetes bacterium GWE2_29_8]|nr:MAG: 50S ribosomal protein L6 [Bacteroidetes bacterium GWE2_29_8]OFY21202.1 MAG: 50S ribosomal protein L6 [Bacteroidetes bacterium GWF2_29_10]
MSRIGKLPISLPKGVGVNIDDKNIVTVKGPLGELQQEVNTCITVTVEDNNIVCKRISDEKSHRAMHGLYRSLIANMVQGVSEGFKIQLEMVGVGYRATANGELLELNLGFSHNVMFLLPKEVKVATFAEKGKNPLIVLTSNDKQLVGQVAAKIRSMRKPEPYKGKGIKYSNEVVRRKAGKAAGK